MSYSLNATKKRRTGKRSNKNFMRAALSHSSQGPAVRGCPGDEPRPRSGSAVAARTASALFRVELERRRVDAVAQPGRPGPVVEHVPEGRNAARVVELV